MSLHKEDMISKLGNKQPEDNTNSEVQNSVKEEPSQKLEKSTSTAIEDKTNGDKKASEGKDSEEGVKNPDSWSKDSALKEVAKLREENKYQRIKLSEKAEEIRQDEASKREAMASELEELRKVQDELAKIKATEEDKKRSLEDKVAHREARIAELEARKEAEIGEREKELEAMKEKLVAFEIQEEARKAMYEDKLQEELGSIPEKFREQAELIAKGAGDSLDALTAINDARMKGLFEDKTVVVNHSVPGAKDGARSSKDQLDAAARSERDKLSGSDKVKQALKDIRQGDKNSAFRMS